MSKSTRRATIAPAVLAMLAATSLTTPQARADIISQLDGAADFAAYVYGTGSTLLISPTPVTVNGNVGVGHGGDANFHGSGLDITGQVKFADDITTSNFTSDVTSSTIFGQAYNNNIPQSEAKGQLVPLDSNALSAATALDNLYAFAKVQTATAGSPSGNDVNGNSFTWNGNAGENVASLTNVNLSSGKTLTLVGSASSYFVLNVSGDWGMSGSGSIVLKDTSGRVFGQAGYTGPSPDNVLFNVLKTADGGTGADIGASGSAMGFGILLAPDRNITFDTPGGSWTGRLFDDSGKTLNLFSEATINQPTEMIQAVPEPSTLISVGLGTLGFIGYTWRRRKAKLAS